MAFEARAVVHSLVVDRVTHRWRAEARCPDGLLVTAEAGPASATPRQPVVTPDPEEHAACRHVGPLRLTATAEVLERETLCAAWAADLDDEELVADVLADWSRPDRGADRVPEPVVPALTHDAAELVARGREAMSARRAARRR